MKALSLWQPWATMIALGLKQFETRSWSTEYRGPLAIHAAKVWTREQREFTQQLFDDPCIGAMLKAHGYTTPEQLPLGGVVCTVKLRKIIGTNEATLSANGIDTIERMLGDYSAGRYAWQMLDVKRIEPVPCRGYQGLWEWTEDGAC